MAVNGNQGEVVIRKSSRQIYGIAPFKVVALNASMEHLIELGIPATKEPEELSKDGKRIINFYLKTNLPEVKKEGSVDKSLEELGLETQLINKLTFFLSDALKGSKDGSTAVWINSFGSICSAPAGSTPADNTWWKHNGEHIAREGEIELIQFIRSWVNAATGDEVFIEDWDALLKGNLTELRDVVKTFTDNVVRAMIEVKVDDKGQARTQIGVRHFEPWNITILTQWVKTYNKVNPPTYFSYVLKEFVPTAPVPTDDPEVTSEEKSDWG